MDTLKYQPGDIVETIFGTRDLIVDYHKGKQGQLLTAPYITINTRGNGVACYILKEKNIVRTVTGSTVSDRSTVRGESWVSGGSRGR